MDKARKGASVAVQNLDLPVFTIPAIPEMVNPRAQGAKSYLRGVRKVSTLLPEVSLPQEKVIEIPLMDDLESNTSDDEHGKAHRGRSRDQKLQHASLQRLKGTRSAKEFWDLIRDWTDAKKQASCVSAEQLAVVFETRLNPPKTMPVEFDNKIHELRSILLSHDEQRIALRKSSSQRHLQRRTLHGRSGKLGKDIRRVYLL
ncbi:hypothetical protein BDP27DRAFT_1433149 [Rhodocollybia butyracea]|uniref:Uncharacterized protein n=1 Tax=Rhodocollybia butyracea TaxID=206335 RepID=A0A9P5P8M1_9AGAR|nr:hypothetical protein BDP27DRAFT_1433149 [Rhodocollybia butyracea]